MSIRTIVVAIMAMICGVTAALGVNRIINERNAETETEAKEPSTVPILVAAVNVSRGTTLTEEMLMTTDWPKGALPQGAVVDQEQLLGRITKNDLVAGEPVFESKLGDGARVSAMIPPGMRAVAILTPNDASIVAGNIAPGDKVDVLFTEMKSDKKLTGGGRTTPLLQNVEVLAIDKNLDADQTRSKTAREMRAVTLVVTPEMANKVSLAQEMGTLHLSLRHQGDGEIASMEGVTLARLNGDAFLGNPMNEIQPEIEAKPIEAEEQPESQVVIRTMRGAIPSRVIMMVPKQRRGMLVAGLPE